MGGRARCPTIPNRYSCNLSLRLPYYFECRACAYTLQLGPRSFAYALTRDFTETYVSCTATDFTGARSRQMEMRARIQCRHHRLKVLPYCRRPHRAPVPAAGRSPTPLTTPLSLRSTEAPAPPSLDSTVSSQVPYHVRRSPLPNAISCTRYVMLVLLPAPCSHLSHWRPSHAHSQTLYCV